MAPPLQYEYHVVGGATARAREHGFHRPRRQVLAAVLGLGRIRGTVHHQDMAAAGLGHEAHGRSGACVTGPTYCAFHGVQLQLG
ncbi:hypothetical protein D9M69_595230 [compost metagenome]